MQLTVCEYKCSQIALLGLSCDAHHNVVCVDLF